jgi:hypothetical protein
MTPECSECAKHFTKMNVLGDEKPPDDPPHAFIYKHPGGWVWWIQLHTPGGWLKVKDESGGTFWHRGIGLHLQQPPTAFTLKGAWRKARRMLAKETTLPFGIVVNA